MPRVTLADEPQAVTDVEIRIQRVQNGYIVKVGHGRHEVHVTVDEVLDRLREVL